MRVSDLAIYPLKSGRGIHLSQSRVLRHGLEQDRRMMLISPSGAFVTQRELPALARISARCDSVSCSLECDDGRSLHISLNHFHHRKSVTIWESTVDVAIAPEEANQALSAWLGQPIELCLFDERASRTASENWAAPGTPVTFSDGYPVLITTTASLAALNADMAAHGEGAVGMERFRPNLVIDCDQPWAEDQWASLSIGGIAFDLVKPCSRCIITSQDQQTGSRNGPSPIAAMGRLRMSADQRVRGVLFGWNAVPRHEGRVSLGDSIEIVEIRPAGIPLKKRGVTHQENP